MTTAIHPAVTITVQRLERQMKAIIDNPEVQLP